MKRLKTLFGKLSEKPYTRFFFCKFKETGNSVVVTAEFFRRCYLSMYFREVDTALKLREQNTGKLYSSLVTVLLYSTGMQLKLENKLLMIGFFLTFSFLKLEVIIKKLI